MKLCISKVCVKASAAKSIISIHFRCSSCSLKAVHRVVLAKIVPEGQNHILCTFIIAKLAKK